MVESTDFRRLRTARVDLAGGLEASVRVVRRPDGGFEVEPASP